MIRSSEIKDPVVFFIATRDPYLCRECRRLHFLADGVTPRCWYFSEIGEGPHRRGDRRPKKGGLHPNCRCSMALMMPGYGFNREGFVTFVDLDYNEIASQRARCLPRRKRQI
jgi:hypothetical protein